MTSSGPILPAVPPVGRAWLTAVSLAERNHDLERQLAELRGSRSWRVTAPLRALLSWLRPDAGVNWQPAPLRSADPGQDLEADGGLPRWLVDVTDLAAHGFQAGVQRVSRRVLAEWLIAPPAGARVEPVRLTPEGRYCHARRFLARFLGQREGSLGPDAAVRPRMGDQFLGLDLVRDYPEPFAAALAWLKAGGIPVSVVVHDVLPHEHPEWFPPRVCTNFRAWLDAVARDADRFLCISHATRAALGRVLDGAGRRGATCEIFPLGADLPQWPLPPETGIGRSPLRVLTVGTIEPRKGHAEILATMESLWRRDNPLQWLVIGRPGWGVASLLAKLGTHPERGRRLVWIEDGDDDEVARAYLSSDLLLNASLGEGYGLPVAEAASLGLPVLLRDIPVFREVAGEQAQYFGGPEPGAPSLADALLRFCAGHVVAPTREPWPRWRDSAQALARILSSSRPPRDDAQTDGD